MVAYRSPDPDRMSPLTVPACRSFLLLCLVAFPLIGCSRAHSEPSVLERYDSLGPQLAVVTARSDRVSLDVSRLGQRVRKGQSRASRRAAVGLKRDALALARTAGKTGNTLRLLTGGAAPGTVRTYLRLVQRSLTADWYEGQALAQLSRVLWQDPLGLVPNTAQELRFYGGRSRRYAAMAVAQARAAEGLRLRHQGAFRYVAVDNKRDRL